MLSDSKETPHKAIQTLTLSQHNIEAAQNLLFDLFNNYTNPILCQNYAQYSLCSDDVFSTAIPQHVIQNRFFDDIQECTGLIVYYTNTLPLAAWIIGKTGITPTFINNSHKTHQHAVYEVLEIFFADSALHRVDLKDFILRSFKQCAQNDVLYSTMILSAKTEEKYKSTIFGFIGGHTITPSNLPEILGNNALHPARFQVQGDEILKCLRLNGTLSQHHIGWDDDIGICTK